MQRKRGIIKRVLALVISFLMVFSIMPDGCWMVLASAGTSTLTTDIDKKTFYVGETKEFTFTTTANDSAGEMVIGSFEFSNPEVIASLEYLESKNGQWYELPDHTFGPETGFPMSDATSKFRVSFRTPGVYSLTVSMKKADDKTTVLCSTTVDVTVKGSASVLSTDIGDTVFDLNETKEFTFTTTANDDAGEMVRGSFVFSDPSAINKLEYLESKNGQWYELNGDFGPASGFPMSDATSKFRVTFNKIGDYTLDVSMKKVSGGEVLCSTQKNISVKDISGPAIESVTGNPSDWTNQNVALAVNATDNSGDVAAYCVNDGAWQTGNQFTISENGTYHFRAKDATGNESVAYTVEVTKIDKAAPVIGTVAYDPDLSTPTNGDVTVTVPATDYGVGGIQFKLDDSGAWQDSNQFTLQDNLEHKVTVKDAFGNYVSTNVQAANIDKERPIINDLTVNKSEWTNQDVVVTVDATDVGSQGLSYWYEGGTPQSENKITISANGTYRFYAKDAAGNISEPKDITILNIDKTAPVIGNVEGNPSAWINQDVTITVSATDEASGGLQYRMGSDGTWQVGNQFSVTENGTYYFYVKDAAGNVTDAYSYVIDKIDKSKPSIDAVVGNAAAWTANSLTMEVQASDLGGSGVKEYKLNTGEWKGENVFTIDENGTYEFYVKDNAGNESAVETVVVSYIDKQPPVISAVTGNPEDWVKNDVTLTVAAADSGAQGIQYRLEAGEWQSSNVFNIETNGTYNIYAKDALGNECAAYPVTVEKIDKKAPVISNIKADITNWTNQNVTIEGQITDFGSGVEFVKYIDTDGKKKNAEYREGTFSFEIERTNYEGKIEVWGIDKLGNEQTVKSEVMVHMDIVNPSLSIITVNPSTWTNGAVTISGNASDEASGIKAFTYTKTDGSVENITCENDHTFEVTLPATDYKGTIPFYIEDNAGNQNKMEPMVYMDVTKPEVNDAIQVSKTDWTNEAVTISGSVTDVEENGVRSGVKEVKYSYDNVIEATAVYEELDGTFTFTIPKTNYDGEVKIWCVDKAGNESVKKTVAVKMDIEKPIMGTDIAAESPTWTNQDVKITGTVSDLKVNGAESKVKTVKYKDTNGDEKEVKEEDFDGKNYTITLPATDYEGNIEVWCIDNAGNVSASTSVRVYMDVTAPTVDTIKAVSDDWTKEDVVISGVVSDTACKVVTVYCKLPSGERALTTEEFDGTNYCFTVNKQDFKGNIAVRCVDEAGNESVEKLVDVYMDITAPNAVKITYSSSPLETIVKNILEVVTFGFYDADVEVTVTAEDNLALKEIQYTYEGTKSELDTTVVSKTETLPIDTDETNEAGDTVKGHISFRIPAQFYGKVTAIAYDMAGNETKQTKSGAGDAQNLDGIIVDTVSPKMQVKFTGPLQDKIEADVEGEKPSRQTKNESDSNTRFIYNGDITAEITVTEGNFYGEDVQITVYRDGEVVTDPDESGWIQQEEKNTFVNNIIFHEDGDYQIAITYADKSQNKMDYDANSEYIGKEEDKATEYVSNIHTIDTVAPSYEVTYDPYKVIQTVDNRDYLKAATTATIHVTDRNFRPNEVSLAITAFDAENQPVGFNCKDYTSLDNWNYKGNNLWEATVPLDMDANYTVAFSCDDIAGHAGVLKGTAEQSYKKEVTVDTTDPTKPVITYKTSALEVFLDTITFGFFGADVEVTIASTDRIALDKISYVYEGVTGKYAGTAVKKQDTVAVDSNGEVKFTLPAQFRGTVSAVAYDKSNNDSEEQNIAEDQAGNKLEGTVIDNVSPKVVVEFTGPLQDKIDVDVDGVKPIRQTKAESDQNTRFVYDGDVTAKITVTEANFYEDMVITVYRDKEVVNDSVISEWVQQGAESNVFVKTIKLQKDGDYQIAITYADKSQNKMDYDANSEYIGKEGDKATEYVSNIHTIDTVAPSYKITYDPYKAIQTVDNRDYLDAATTATIQVTDRNFRPNEVEFAVEAKDVSKEADVEDYTYDALKNWTAWSDKGNNTWEATVPFDKDANYTAKFAYTDIANHAGVISGTTTHQYEKEFTVDRIPPTSVKVSYQTDIVNKILSTILFYQTPATVTISAKDATAGIEYFTINTSKDGLDKATTVAMPSNLVIKADGSIVSGTEGFIKNIQSETNGGRAEISFKVPNEFRGELIVSGVTDYSHNTASKYDDTTVVAVDKVSPEISVKYKTADTTKVQFVDEKCNTVDSMEAASAAYYNGNVTAVVEIDEANFFEGQLNSDNTVIHEVGIKLTKADDYDNVVTTEYLPTGAAQKYTDVDETVEIQWTLTNGKYSFEIPYEDNADYVLQVEYTDFSGNASEVNAGEVTASGTVHTFKTITVDKKEPIISVEYSNDHVIHNVNERDYFDASQTATITVVEHNFRADDFAKSVITAKDVEGNEVATENFVETLCGKNEEHKWEKVEGQYNTYRITLNYNVDANYTFDYVYQDLAQNAAKDYDADAFTVDTTAPKNLTVTYSTSVLDRVLESITFGYYNAKMTVTITAEDETAGIHYFVYSYIKNAGVSNVNSELLDQKIEDANRNITYNGKTATASFTIPKLVLGNDNQFNGTVKFTAFDRSENSTKKADNRRVVVDNIRPTATISYNEPVKKANDISYYEGDIEAKIVVTEANFYSEDVKVSLTKDDTAYPVNVKWVDDSVDVHTGTFTLTEDGDYVVTIEYADRSSNQMDRYVSNRLTKDSKAPTIYASDIVNNSANKSEKYSFTITAKDVNLDSATFEPTLTAVVMNEGGTFETKTLSLGEMKTIESGKEYSFTVDDLEEDAIYVLSANVKDMSNNSYGKIALADGKEYDNVQFSINRNGSVFSIDEYTAGVVEKYYIQEIEHDLVVMETNADELKEYKVTLNGKTLQEGKDYTVGKTGGDEQWMKYTYSIKKALFESEGEYKLVVSSKDKAESDAFSDVKDAAVNFVVDRTAPLITVTGLAKNGRYQTDLQTVTLIPSDDGGALKTVKVLFVDKDGNVIDEILNLSEEELVKALADSGKLTFDIQEGLYQNVQIICEDYAGNIAGAQPEDIYTNVSVSSSAVMIFWANKPLRWGTIGGVVAMTAAVVLLVFRKRKRL